MSSVLEYVISKKETQRKPFFKKSSQEGHFYFGLGKKLYFMKISESQIVKLALLKLNFEVREILQLEEKNQILLIMTKGLVQFYIHDGEREAINLLKEINEKSIFPETYDSEEDKKSKFSFRSFSLTSSNKKFTFCLNQKQLEKKRVKREQISLLQQDCKELENFCLDIKIQEPMTEKDFSKLHVCLN